MLQDHPPVDETADDYDVDPLLHEIRTELASQTKKLNTTGRNFSIFAVIAMLLSFSVLIAVAAKLDKPTKTVTVVRSTTAPATAAPAAPLPTTVGTTLTEMKIGLSASTVAAGRVTFNVINKGAATHEMVVLDTPTAAADLATSSSGRADESTNIGETGDVKAGASKSFTLNLKAGHYALICNLPGHYKAGMRTDLIVK